MTQTIELNSTRCAICGTDGNATETYKANFDLTALNPTVFSARRLPDRVHYRLVRCKRCTLVRSDPIASPELLARLYTESTVTYGDEVTDLRHTYGRYLDMLGRSAAEKHSLLEIGCGDGFFLEEALSRGYQEVRGVEPSQAAVDQADPKVRDHIVCDVMRAGLFAPEQFDVVCLFQVFDHIADPAAVLKECFAVLKPGGVVLAINHNIDAVSARVLGERSPIVDIEHTYLYSPATMARVFAPQGFQVRKIGAVYNRYSLYYLCRLLPLPDGIKRTALAWLQQRSIGQWRMWVPLGNLFLIAQKPLAHGD